MEQTILQTLVAQGLSIAKIASNQGCSQGSVRYWLRKYGLQTRRGPRGKHPKDFQVPCKCSCGETDPKKFYGRKRSVCGKCHSQYTLLQGQEKRQKALSYLGSACSNPDCGFDRFSSALAFHHLDPTKKDPSFSSYRGWSWGRLKKELGKCIILCACCHAAVHAKELKITWA